MEKDGSGIKEKSKTGLAWAGFFSIIYVAYQYVGLFPYLLFGAEGWNLAFPDMTVPLEYLVTAAKVFVASAGIALVALFLLGIKKKDVENV